MSICYSTPVVVVTLVSPVPGTTPGPGHMLSAHLSDELHKTTIGSEPHDKGGPVGVGAWVYQDCSHFTDEGTLAPRSLGSLPLFPLPNSKCLLEAGRGFCMWHVPSGQPHGTKIAPYSVPGIMGGPFKPHAAWNVRMRTPCCREQNQCPERGTCSRGRSRKPQLP